MKVKGRFKGISTLVSDSQIISSEGYLEACEQVPDVIYTKRDFLFTGGVWRGRYVPCALQLAMKQGIEHVIVGHSDHSTNRMDLFRAQLITRGKIQSISGVNVYGATKRLETFPLGVTSNEPESTLHNLLRDNTHFLKASQVSNFCENYSSDIYVNFTVANNSAVRSPIIDLVRKLDRKVHIEEPSISQKGRIKFLSMLRQSSLTLCPEGNGLDTHRLWETLYMGGTPVVKNNSRLNDFYRQFPIVILPSWKDLYDTELLYKLWTDVGNLEWDSKKLSLSYWTRKIHGKT